MSINDAKINDIEIKYGPDRGGDIHHSLASVDKAKEFLGYEPSYRLEEGLKSTINWFTK